MKTLTIQEWFDTYYPKEWGDWRKYYNIGMYRNTHNKTGCAWMDYGDGLELIGLNNRTDILKTKKVKPVKGKEVRFVQCGTKADESTVNWYIQPYEQPDGTYWGKVILRQPDYKQFSDEERYDINNCSLNLDLSKYPTKSNAKDIDLWEIYIAGCDDASYTKQIIGKEEALSQFKLIIENGIPYDFKDCGYEFTN